MSFAPSLVSFLPSPRKRRRCRRRDLFLGLMPFLMLLVACSLPCRAQDRAEADSNELTPQLSGDSSAKLCPASCPCLGTLVDCSKKRLTRLPPDLPHWVEILDLSHNSLSEIPTGSFDSLVNLKKLYLSHNAIELKEDLFRSKSTLEELKLDNNHLTDFPTLPNLPRLTSLIVHHNDIKDLVNKSLSMYISLETLDLSYNRLTTVPMGFFVNRTISSQAPNASSAATLKNDRLKSVTLSNNRLTDLENGSLDNLTALETLRLAKNKISLLPKGLFTTLGALKELDLSRNKLRIIEGLTFYGLVTLENLKLRRNELTNLLDGAFYDLSSIQSLHLDRNNLTIVNKGWLYGLVNLKQLTLSHNAINQIDKDGWEFCQRLWELDLTHNRLEALTRETFAHLQSLQYLLLDHNSISFIEEGSFKKLSALEIMELNHNHISWMIEDTNGPFNGLDRLQRLGLAHNHIKSIARKAFLGLTQLRTLDLTHNPIMSAEDHSFASLKQMEELRLNSTQFLCDCNLKWLVSWMRTMRGSRQYVKSAKCKHPASLAERNLLDTNADNFTCTGFPKPYIVEEPRTQIALKGSNLTLTCKAASSSSSQMSFQWRKDNILLNLTHNKNHDEIFAQAAPGSNGTLDEYMNRLHLINVEDSDEGKYQCIASNSFGTVYSQKAKITVHVMPTFTKSPLNVTVKAGSTARLECATKGQPAPEISWQKDGGDDFPAARERRMHVMPSDDVFFIVDIKAVDMGLYSCRAKNVAGLVETKATLTVLENPNFVKPMQDKKTKAGETAVLECMAAGSPKPALTWTKDGGPLMATERHFFTADNQLLIIVKSQTTDGGLYSCEMSNNLGSVKQSLELTVIPEAQEENRAMRRSTFATWFPDSWTTGLIIIAVVMCVVITSLVWVIIIYKTRRPDTYFMTETSTTSTTMSLEKGVIKDC